MAASFDDEVTLMSFFCKFPGEWQLPEFGSINQSGVKDLGVGADAGRALLNQLPSPSQDSPSISTGTANASLANSVGDHDRGEKLACAWLLRSDTPEL